MKKITLLILLIAYCYISNGQSIIKGILTAKDKKLASISMLAHLPGNKNAIIAFAISKADGSYEINLNSKLDSISISTSSLNYADKYITIANRSQELNFELIAQQHKLNEVLIKAKPILFKKDTTIYTVGAFAKENDRSIGDIINKLPGFEVSQNGAIYFQGKKIEKYYIEGLDLLGGKYNVANKNLSYKSVQSIEVMENHQPIKMLDTLVFSDKTSINIRLKKNTSIAGSANLGIGANPILWDINFTPMFFNKKQQAIASYQTNNIGEDVADQLIPHYFSQMKDDLREELISIRGINTPAIAKNRYLDNNIHLITYNHLVKLNNNSNIKINTSYINDYQKQENHIQSIYFTANDTIKINDINHTNNFTNKLKTEIIYENNGNSKFIKNKLSLAKQWDSANGISQYNIHKYSQRATTPYSAINNHFKCIFPYKKHLITIKSKIAYNKTPQELNVEPGIFSQIINNRLAYNSTIQNISLENIYTENSISFSINKRKWNFENELGITYKYQELNSFISANNKIIDDENLQNDSRWEKLTAYFAEDINYKTSFLNINLRLPIKNINYKIRDKQNTQAINKLILNPSLSANYKINGYFTANASINYFTRFGNILDRNSAYIMSEYNTIYKNDSPLKETNNYNTSLYLKYVNPIGNWFASLILNKSISKRNLIYNFNIADSGSTNIEAIERENKNYNESINININKLLSDLGTTIYIKTSLQRNKGKTINNSIFTDLKRKTILIEPRISISKFIWMSLDYKFQYTKTYQTIAKAKSQFINTNHILAYNLYPKANHSLGINIEQYHSKSDYSQNNSMFANMNYKWKPKETKMTLEFKCYNLFNNDSYTSVYNSEIATITNTIGIRPRQFIISLAFSIL